MIEVRTTDTLEGFAALAAEWDALLGASGVNHLYLTHDFLYSWWESLASGSRLRIITVREDGALLAIAPLMLRRGSLVKLPVRKLEFIGSGWGYGGIILSRKKDECVSAILRHLDGYRDWDVLLMSQTLMDPDLGSEAITGLLGTTGLAVSSSEVRIPRIPLTTTWDKYLSDRSSSFRRNMRAKERKAHELGRIEHLRIQSARSSGITHEERLQMMKTVADNSWKDKAGTAISSDESVFSFYSNLTRRLDESGRLDLSILLLDGAPIAYIYGAVHNRTFFEIDIAFDERHSKASPGVVLRNMLLQKLFSEGLEGFDFVANYDYKSELTTDYSSCGNYLVYKKRLYPRLLRFLRSNVYEAVKNDTPARTARRFHINGYRAIVKKLTKGA